MRKQSNFLAYIFLLLTVTFWAGNFVVGKFASFYNDFGTEVTVVEAQEYILPSEDKEISMFAKKCFEDSKIKIFNKSMSIFTIDTMSFYYT